MLVLGWRFHASRVLIDCNYRQRWQQAYHAQYRKNQVSSMSYSTLLHYVMWLVMHTSVLTRTESVNEQLTPHCIITITLHKWHVHLLETLLYILSFCRYWMSVGAQPSDPVARLLGQAGVMPPPPRPQSQQTGPKKPDKGKK